MESNIQPSFIPKKPINQPGAKATHKISFFSLIATVILITAFIIAGAVFGYRKFMESKLEKKGTELQVELNKFQRSLVSELARLDMRFNSAGELLEKHLSVSTFFNVLGKSTLRSIRYANFTYKAELGAAPKIKMEGQAQNFAAVALQIDEFNNTENKKYFTGVQVTEPNLDQKGNITFMFNSELNAPSFSYATVQLAKGVSISSTTPFGSTTQQTGTTTSR